jgi:hypothetical protein
MSTHPTVSRVRILLGRQYLQIRAMTRDHTGRIIDADLQTVPRAAASRIEPYTAAELSDYYTGPDGTILTTEIA